jgi:cell division protein FtsL
MSIKNFFALLFIISLSIFLYLRFGVAFLNQNENKNTIRYEESSQQNIKKSSYLSYISVKNNLSLENENFILLTSLITAVLSFLGFIISSYYSMRNRRRNEEIFNLQREKERLEMEKLQQEILALQRGEL